MDVRVKFRDSRSQQFYGKTQEAHQLDGPGKTTRHKIRPKAIGGSIFGRFSDFDKCRLEVAGDAISNTTVGMDVRVKFAESDSLPAAPVLRTFVQYLIAFGSRQEAASDVISGMFVRLIVTDRCVQFCDLT